MASSYYTDVGKYVNDGDTILASDHNTINSSVDLGFQQVEADLTAIESDAETYAGIAQQWAEEAEDTEVAVGQYSALHHRAKAEDAQGLAETAQGAAETAQGLTEGYRDETLGYRNEVEPWHVDIGGADGTGNTSGWRYDCQTALSDIQVIEAAVDHVNSYSEVADPASPYTPDFPNNDTVTITGIDSALTVDIEDIANGRTVSIFYEIASGGSIVLSGGTKDVYFSSSGLQPTGAVGWGMMVLTGVNGKIFVTFAEEFST